MDVSKLTQNSLLIHCKTNQCMYKVLYTQDVIANVRYFSKCVELFEFKQQSSKLFY